MELSELAHLLEEFQCAVAQDLFDVHTKQKVRSELPILYEKYSELFQTSLLKDRLQEVQKMSEQGSIEYLSVISAWTQEFFTLHAQLPQAEVALRQIHTKVEIDGEIMDLRMAQHRAMNESDRSKRSHLFRAVEKATVDELNPVLLRMYDELDKLSQQLGFNRYVDLCANVRGFELETLITELRNLLVATKEEYRNLLGEVALEELHISHSELERSDSSELWRLNRYAAFFPYESALNVLQSFLSEIGIQDLFANVSLEVRPPGKGTRSFCLPIHVPDQISLILALRGRTDDYRILFHEAGHALHHSAIQASSPPWVRRWGDPIVSEAFAFLFENLMGEKAFVARYIGELDENYFKILSLYRMFQLRRNAAKVIWELQSSDTLNPQSSAKYWSNLLTEETGFSYTGANAFMDREFFLYSVTYLRAWMLTAQLNNSLRRQFGECWFFSKEAGSFLRGLWSNEKFETPESLSKRLGYEGLDSACLLDDFRSHCRVFSNK